MSKLNIYTIGVEVMSDLYEFGLFKKKLFKKDSIKTMWKTPVLATNKDEAINIYKSRYNWEVAEYIYFGYDTENIRRKVICASSKNKYTFKELQEEMNSEDFLKYCRQELNINDIVNEICK